MQWLNAATALYLSAESAYCADYDSDSFYWIQRRSEGVPGGAGRTGRHLLGAANGRKLFLKIHVKIQIVISYVFACNKKSITAAARTYPQYPGLYTTSILMLLLTLRETYTLNRLSSFQNLWKGGKFDHRPERPKILLRHWLNNYITALNRMLLFTWGCVVCARVTKVVLGRRQTGQSHLVPAVSDRRRSVRDYWQNGELEWSHDDGKRWVSEWVSA